MSNEGIISKRFIFTVALLIVAPFGDWISEASACTCPSFPIRPGVILDANTNVVGGLPGQSSDKKPAMSPDARDRVRQVIDAVGIIWVRDLADPSTPIAWRRGSGVLVRKDGIIVTNYHVITIEKRDRIYDEILFSLPAKGTADALLSNRYRLKVLLVSKGYDLALLRIVSDNEGKPITESMTFPSIEIGDSRAIRELDDLIIIGFPEKGGSTVTVNTGIVEGKDLLENWIKTDARLIHGNSGCAAVNTDGKLIGIPTKIVSDEKRVDKDGDGFPDEVRNYGEVGFLRPSYLVASMLARLGDAPQSRLQGKPQIGDDALAHAKKSGSPLPQSGPQFVPSVPLVTVRGIIKSANDGSPIAGARIGLVPIGSEDVTPKNLLTWGSTNSDGKFQLNNAVPAGRYMLRAKSLRYEAVTRNVEIVQGGQQIVIEMRLLRDNQ